MSASKRVEARSSEIDAAELRRNPPRLLSFKELVVFLQISERHARNLIAGRRIPVLRLGDRVIFNTERVIAALERGSI